MLHVPPLVSTLAIGLVLALSLGVVANRFKLPPLIGYLVAGIVIGPFTPWLRRPPEYRQSAC